MRREQGNRDQSGERDVANSAMSSGGPIHVCLLLFSKRESMSKCNNCPIDLNKKFEVTEALSLLFPNTFIYDILHLSNYVTVHKIEKAIFLLQF